MLELINSAQRKPRARSPSIGLIVQRTLHIFQNNGMSYIWATQDINVDSNNVHQCDCDQFKQLWHSRNRYDAIDSNTIMYKTFKYSRGKENYTEISLNTSKKRYCNLE